LYRKNLPTWERWLRVILGVALLAYPILAGPPLLLTVLALVSAAVVVVTGFIGFCPACAMVGRKWLDQDTREG
jgi:antibiotic biosynthesis monooxygenase (ABM) superfamily enzyme